ncbi:Uncharacterised protein [Salmonella enterica subsp. enterica]|uniref:Uncharacterized protein n=1 Tax=Salmonella enterica I TaxID=59201 RepID=A0A379X068_SALET|nr:Uncharacterised protein [Salmonella enterica subsp. enterica]
MLNKLDKVVEQRRRIVRAWARLRVTLEAERRFVGTMNPCRVPSNSDLWVTRRFAGSESSSTAKPWFCAVIITTFRSISFYRMVAAVMAELHLNGLRTARQRQQLMAEADAK